jgi:hypothetical protein
VTALAGGSPWRVVGAGDETVSALGEGGKNPPAASVVAEGPASQAVRHSAKAQVSRGMSAPKRRWFQSIAGERAVKPYGQLL